MGGGQQNSQPTQQLGVCLTLEKFFMLSTVVHMV